MRDIMLNYYKHIALPACLTLIFGMPLFVQAADDTTTMSEEKYKQADEYSEDMGQTGGRAQLNAETKQKFVNAYIEIRGIRDKYAGRMENINDEQKARELQEQAQSEMVEIVEQNDMTVHEYNQVVSAIGSDPELRMEIEQMAQAKNAQ